MSAIQFSDVKASGWQTHAQTDRSESCIPVAQTRHFLVPAADKGFKLHLAVLLPCALIIHMSLSISLDATARLPSVAVMHSMIMQPSRLAH